MNFIWCLTLNAWHNWPFASIYRHEYSEFNVEVSAGVFRHSYSADSISERDEIKHWLICAAHPKGRGDTFLSGCSPFDLYGRPLCHWNHVTCFTSSRVPNNLIRVSWLCKLVTGLTTETIRSVLWVNVSCRTRFRLEKKGKCCSRMRSQGVEKCRISNSCRADKIVSPPCHFCLACQTILKSFLLKWIRHLNGLTSRPRNFVNLGKIQVVQVVKIRRIIFFFQIRENCRNCRNF